MRVALLLCWSRCWTNQPRVDHRRARTTENQGARRRQAIREKKRAIARSASGVTTFPTSTRNVIEVLNLSCRSAQELDTKSDDGNFASGNTRASVASCAEGSTNDPVPSMALAL